MDDVTARQALEVEQGRNGMHGPTPLLGPDGQPIVKSISPSQRRKLSEEEARPELVGVRTLWDQSVASGLTPERLATLLRGAVRGDHRLYLELAEEMEERDAHYFSVLGTRKRALSSVSPAIDEESASKTEAKIAFAVEELLDDPSFPDLVEDLLDGLGKGYSVVEILWCEREGLWRPHAYLWRDPKYFTFDYISRSEVRLAELGTLDGRELPPFKFITHVPRQKSGIPIRGGFARFAAWAFLFKNYGLKDWASFLDVYGMPIRIGKYHPSATPEERRKLLQAVMQIASDAAAIIPESMLIELLETKNAGGGTSTPFEQIARFLDEQMSKMILGQTMTVENGGSLAQAKVHNQIRLDLLKADARQLAVTLNRHLIAPFVKLNFGDRAPPPAVTFPIAEPEDIAVLSTALGTLVPLGLKVSQAEVRAKLGLSEPDDGEETLVPQKGAPEKSKDPVTRQALRGALNAAHPALYKCPCGCGNRFVAEDVSLNSAGAGLDEVEAIGSDEAADWEPQMSPIVEAILDAADASSSFDEFKQLLAQLAGDLDTSALQSRLAIAQMKARGLGSAKNGGR
jgi:phage gp29-like protein